MKKLFYIFILTTTFILIYSCASLKTRGNIANEYYNIGNEYFEMENYTKAIASYLKALEYNPNLSSVKINLILSYQQSKQYDKSEKMIFNEYKDKIDDYNKNLLLLMGNNYYYQQKYDYGIKILLAYIQSYPTDINGYFNLALCYNKSGDEQNFLKYLLEVYGLNKTYAPVLYNLGDYYYNKKDFENSMKYYKELIETDKTAPEPFYRLGLIEYQLEEYEYAKERFTKCIELDKENNNYYLELAKVYAKGFKDRKSTLENIEKALMNNFTDLGYLQKQEEFGILNEFKEYNELLKKYNLIKK